MTPAERIDILKFLAQIHRSQFDERRRYEWQALITTLTFYVLLPSAKYTAKVSTPDTTEFKILVAVFFLLLAVTSIMFLAYVHMANNKNKSIAENAERLLAKRDVLRQDQETVVFDFSRHWTTWDTFRRAGSAGNWAWWWQGLILLLFALASWYMVTSAQFMLPSKVA